jgi:hypothetical protein
LRAARPLYAPRGAASVGMCIPHLLRTARRGSQSIGRLPVGERRIGFARLRPGRLTGELSVVLQSGGDARRNLAVCRNCGVNIMKYSLRKTPSHLHLAYKYGEGSDGLMGRHFTLDVDDRVLTLSIDLTPNFHTRNKSASEYLDAVNLAHNHHKLRYLQCADNLVRARLIKAWEQVQQPQLRMCLELGQRGRYLYTVQPHSLFMGGIQFDVQDVLPDEPARSRPHTPHAHSPGNHA